MRDRKNPLGEFVSSFAVIMVAFRKDISRTTVRVIEGTLEKLRGRPSIQDLTELQKAAQLPLPESDDEASAARRSAYQDREAIKWSDSDLQYLLENYDFLYPSPNPSAPLLPILNDADERAFREPTLNFAMPHAPLPDDTALDSAKHAPLSSEGEYSETSEEGSDNSRDSGYDSDNENIRIKLG